MNQKSRERHLVSLIKRLIRDEPPLEQMPTFLKEIDGILDEIGLWSKTNEKREMIASHRAEIAADLAAFDRNEVGTDADFNELFNPILAAFDRKSR